MTVKEKAAEKLEFSWVDELSQVFGKPSKVVTDGTYEAVMYSLPPWQTLFVAKQIIGEEAEQVLYHSVVVGRPKGEDLDKFIVDAEIFKVRSIVRNLEEQAITFSGVNNDGDTIILKVLPENYEIA